MSTRRLALALALATGAVLLVMVAVSMITGATQETHEHYKPAADYARDLLAHPGGARLLFGLDIAFLILYTAFFGTLARYLHGYASSRPYAWLGFGAMVLVAILDIVEDHHILSLLALAENGRPIDDSAIAFQSVLSSTKFSVSYLSLFLFGISIPRTSKLGWALCLFLTAGNLLSAVIDYAIPPSARDSFDSGRWIGFLLGFGLAFLWLRTAPDRGPDESTSS